MNTFRNFSKCLLFAISIISKVAFAADTLDQRCPTAIPQEPLWTPPEPYAHWNDGAGGIWNSWTDHRTGEHMATRSGGTLKNPLEPNEEGNFYFQAYAKCVFGAWMLHDVMATIWERRIDTITGATDDLEFDTRFRGEGNFAPLPHKLVLHKWLRKMPRTKDNSPSPGDHTTESTDFYIVLNANYIKYEDFDSEIPFETFLLENYRFIDQRRGYHVIENWTDRRYEDDPSKLYKTKSSITTWNLGPLTKRKSDVQWEYRWWPRSGAAYGVMSEHQKDVSIKEWALAPNPSESNLAQLVEKTNLTLVAKTYRPGYPKSYNFNMTHDDYRNQRRAHLVTINYGKFTDLSTRVSMWQPILVKGGQVGVQNVTENCDLFAPNPGPNGWNNCKGKITEALRVMFEKDVDKVISPADPDYYLKRIGSVPPNF